MGETSLGLEVSHESTPPSCPTRSRRGHDDRDDLIGLRFISLGSLF